MSDPKRATLITVGASKNDKKKVNKTVRLAINLVESNESKYPELNYKKLVIAEEKKKVVENGKPEGLNSFSDNDDDVERVARKFEQKYGGNSTYGRKGRSKNDDFADIGAGYDENDSFIDNTDGYDEMIPPECDTLYGGFYINCGSLEFKSVPDAAPMSEDEIGEPGGVRRKRRISSSSSEVESSDSSSESESLDEKDPTRPNGAMDSHETEHRKKKNKNTDKNNAKIRRTDSSAATSGKQTSDDNNHGDGESADSRTSQSDSLTSKPAPSSENAATSDSSRDVEAKVELKLLPAVTEVLEELEAAVSRQLMDNPQMPVKEMETNFEQYIIRLDTTLSKCHAEGKMCRAAWSRAARTLSAPRAKLMQRVKALHSVCSTELEDTPPPSASQPVTLNPATNTTNPTTSHNKRRADDELDDVDLSRMSADEREAKIVETLQRLKALIEEKKPGMIANYSAECERVQEERKKMQIASAADGAPHIEKRLPKRRFPWCQRSRTLLSRLRRLAGGQEPAAILLAKRALPLFPNGFVRMPTLLRQADVNKDIKVNEFKRQRLGSASQPIQPAQPAQFTDNIQFPSSLTVTTSMKPTAETNEVATKTNDTDKYKGSSVFGNIINSFSLSKDLVVETQEGRKKSVIAVDKGSDDLYIPPNNIGSSLTITAVPSSQSKVEKTANSMAPTTDKNKEPLIRVKSPAALNEMVSKKEKEKALENIQRKEKEKALEMIHVKEKERALENIHKKEKERALENIQRKEKEKSLEKERAIEILNKKEKERLLENIYGKEKERALENIHKKEKDRPFESVHKKEKDKFLETIHIKEKERALENLNMKEKERTLDMVHTKEKDRALENIHKREKERAFESIHTKEKEKAIDNMHMKEKERALENIHKKDKDKHKKSEKNHVKEKRVDSPLHIDTSYQPRQKEPAPSPKSKPEEISKRLIETMRVAENNIPRPALVPVHHSPTFAKPDKRPPELKKKKDLLIISDLDPLADGPQEPVAVDDSSSDVEVIEDNKSEKQSVKSDSVPSKDKSVHESNHKRVDVVRHSSKDVPTDGRVRDGEKKGENLDAATKKDFDSLMKNLRDLEHSQEQPKFNSSHSGPVSSAKREKSSSHSQPFNSRGSIYESRSDKDKLDGRHHSHHSRTKTKRSSEISLSTERTSLNKMDGCNPITGSCP